MKKKKNMKTGKKMKIGTNQVKIGEGENSLPLDSYAETMKIYFIISCLRNQVTPDD